jgi:DNA-binding XRE family transcriptional regulator
VAYVERLWASSRRAFNFFHKRRTFHLYGVGNVGKVSEMANGTSPRLMTLKEARELAGLTQRQLASKAGVKAGQISDVELGRIQHPSHRFVVRVIRALHEHGLRGVTAEQVFPIDEAVA